MNSAKRSRENSDLSDSPPSYKSHLECRWSGHGKRASQTATINQAMRKFETRLERIEKGITGMEGSLSRLSLDRRGPARRASVRTIPSPGNSSQSWPDEVISPLSLKHPGRRRSITKCHGYPERYLGPMVLASLIVDVKEFILDSLNESEDIGVKYAISIAHEHLDGLTSTAPTEEAAQLHSAPEMPPISMLEAMAQPYIDSINQKMPIWTPEAFEKFMDSCQSIVQNNSQDMASIICANSVVLLTLAAKSVRLRSKRPSQTQTAEGMKRPSTDLDSNLMRAFLLNAKRSLNKAEQLLCSSMANLRALLSLCLVSQIFFTDEYSIYPPVTSLGDHGNSTLTFIEAQLFQSTYSQTSDLSRVSGLTATIMGLQQQLDKWWDEFGEGRKMSQHPSNCEAEWLDTMSSMWIERAIRYHTLRILLLWSTAESLEDSNTALLDARCCLRLWVRALNSTQELASFAQFPRLLVAYPPVAAMQLVMPLIQSGKAPETQNSPNKASTNSEDDIALLNSFIRDVLDVIDLGLEPNSSAALLSRFTKVLHDIAVAMKSAPSHSLTFGMEAWAAASFSGKFIEYPLIRNSIANCCPASMLADGAAQAIHKPRSAASVAADPERQDTGLGCDLFCQQQSDSLAASWEFPIEMSDMGEGFFNGITSDAS
ncbi:hypothetical protein NLG97_g5788 [Lecanicillium saksenae]|uniref:Uncharacterized protein n=1 Tax=Lecanicillium saksenae TaxID=468837 RepID=A0ACC1QSU6_9HYPO|nr:hypothetical protein NLG97_g5788 [Lecanicillium saksenae]